MERVDVVVVGGGPAGTAAAKAAADGGADAVVFEKGVPREDREGDGADSTDAAGILDYWVDLMGFDPDEIPEELIYRELDGAEFIGPTERVAMEGTGIDASYPHFGFTYDRAGFDDWMRERAGAAGADYRIGAVRDVETTPGGDPTHEVVLADGSSVGADALILADGPQRTVTLDILRAFLDGIDERLDSTRVNHIAYQEYRRFPEGVFEPSTLKFWWGYIPGHTAYPWVFPNDDTVARVGLTMPIGLDLSTVEDREEYALLRPGDDRVPAGGEYIRRLLETAYPGYDLDDFPLVEGRGKNGGTETYPISSTRPIDSPTGANVAITGGAMGATSAFHEGGGHLAVRTGKIAGDLAARGDLDRYNDAWKAAVGEEIRRNVAMADLVRDYGPGDWDRAFRTARRVLESAGTGTAAFRHPIGVGWRGLSLAAGYYRRKYGYRDGRYVQIREREYEY
ncbi:MAG: NAD(P)/FAD-dependent oxidoreductase [Halobacteriales archaeon]